MTLGAPRSLNVYFSIVDAVIFPPILHVFDVTQNMQNENSLGPVIDIGDQPAPVMADIKNNAATDTVGIATTLFYVREVRPLGGFGYPIPG